MPIFSSSRRTSSRSRAGFTLIELLISAAIITVISGIVLVRFNAFDSTVLLKSIAYEVGTTVREAQIYSLSVFNLQSGSQITYRYPYGLSFTPSAKSYVFFRYTDPSPSAVPKYEPPTNIQTIRSINLGSSIEVYDVCVTTASGDNCNISRLDVSFRRPEFAALFYTPEVAASNILAGKIILQSTRNTANKWVVEIKLLGQIIVYKQ